MKNIRLTLAYDGTNFVGWQVQPNGVSVQSVVERAIEKLTGLPAKLRVAGRTDSGVHAIGQVANFETESDLPIEAYRDGLQHHLPTDIVVRDACEVGSEFHATYSVKRKRYRYVIHNSRIPNPLIRNFAWNYHGQLDTTAMHHAAQTLLGEHDFRSFESHFPNKATSVRTVIEVRVHRTSGWPIWMPETKDRTDTTVGEGEAIAEPMISSIAARQEPRPPDFEATSNEDYRASESDGEFICFDIVANGFLYNMVRAIVGTLIRVGRQDWNAEDVSRIISAKDRSQAGETAPPHGLYLVYVDYE